MHSEEIWKKIPNFKFYEASNFGRVRSIDRIIAQKQPRYGDTIIYRKFRSRILKPCLLSDKGKYPHFSLTLCEDTIKHKLLVHRIILNTFVGECPEGMQGCHNDGNGLNNYLDNLRWDTASNNQLDRHKHGTHFTPIMKGSEHPKAILDEQSVIKIRGDRSSGMSTRELSDKYLIKIDHVRSIIKRNTWKHL